MSFPHDSPGSPVTKAQGEAFRRRLLTILRLSAKRRALIPPFRVLAPVLGCGIGTIHRQLAILRRLGVVACPRKPGTNRIYAVFPPAGGRGAP